MALSLILSICSPCVNHRKTKIPRKPDCHIAAIIRLLLGSSRAHVATSIHLARVQFRSYLLPLRKHMTTYRTIQGIGHLSKWTKWIKLRAPALDWLQNNWSHFVTLATTSRIAWRFSLPHFPKASASTDGLWRTTSWYQAILHHAEGHVDQIPTLSASLMIL